MRRLIIILLVALPLAAAPEKWAEEYTRGTKLLNAGNPAAAAQALERAIAERPAEAANVRAANQILPYYVPHFFLGIAKMNLGDPDAALRELRISEEQGVVQGTPYFAQLRDWRAQAVSEKQRRADSAASGPRSAADAAVTAAFKAQTQAMSAHADTIDSYRAGQRKLQEARDIVKSAGSDVAAYRRAAAVAGEAQQLFAAAREEQASKPKPQPAPVKPQPQEFVVPFNALPPTPQPQPVPVTPAPQPVKPAPMPAPVPQPAVAVESPELADARVALQSYRRRLMEVPPERRNDKTIRRALEDTAKAQAALAPDADSATIRRIVAEIRRREAELTVYLALKPATPPPANDLRARLESAYRAYAQGDLAAAEQMLSALIATKPSAEAYLLRGCARYTQAMLARGDLASAAADFKAALQLNGRLRLDAAVFSPKLVQYFETLKRR
jgi:outer membrane biosynthesis protein TonB